MKVHPVPDAIFQTTRSGFIRTFYHCSVSWKITPLCVLAQTSNTLNKKSPWQWNFQWLSGWVVGWKFTKFLMSCLKPQVSFTLNSESLFTVIIDNFLIWTRRSLSKCKISSNLYFDRLLLLSIYKILTKKYRGVIFHDTEVPCKIWRKTDLWFSIRN